MTVRTIEFIVFTSKNILKRNLKESIKRIAIISIQIVIMFAIKIVWIDRIIVATYASWILLAIITGIVTATIVTLMNVIIYHEDFKEGMNILKKCKR